MQCPAGKCLRLRKMLARQISDSLANRKKAARHPQNFLASIYQRVHLQNAAVHVGTPHDIKCIIYSGRLIFNHFSHFPDGNPTTATETCTSKRSRVLTDIQKEKKNMIFCYFETIEQLSYGISWSELINNLLTQGINIRKRLWSALRLTCGSISQRKWTYRDFNRTYWETGLRRYCCRTASRFLVEVLWHPYETEPFFLNSVHTTAIYCSRKMM